MKASATGKMEERNLKASASEGGPSRGEGATPSEGNSVVVSSFQSEARNPVKIVRTGLSTSSP